MLLQCVGKCSQSPQHLQFIGAGGIAAPGLRERECTLRPLPFWRLSSLFPADCFSMCIADDER